MCGRHELSDTQLGFQQQALGLVYSRSILSDLERRKGYLIYTTELGFSEAIQAKSTSLQCFFTHSLPGSSLSQSVLIVEGFVQQDLMCSGWGESVTMDQLTKSTFI